MPSPFFTPVSVPVSTGSGPLSTIVLLSAVTVRMAWPIVKLAVALLPVWLASPVKLALAVAVPTLMLSE